MIRINDQQFWLYAAGDPQTNDLLHVRLFSTTTTALTEMFLTELRGKHDVRTYDSLEDDQTIEALARELERMVDGHSGKQRKYLLGAKEDAEFALQSPLGRIIDQFHEEFGV